MQLEPPAAMADSHEIENLWIPLSDGCRLAARLFLPAGQATPPAPAILEYIPYRKRDFMRRRDESIHRWFAAQGYAAVRVDLRGSGESDGIMHDEYLKQELDDAVEVIAWIAAQPWCTGKVGMMGKSWGAYNSVQVAALRPPALKAIIAVMGTDDRYAECIHYSGGCLMLDNFWWGCIMQIFNARPPDPAIVGESWREAWLARLEAETFWPEIWLQHQTLDDYWKHGSVSFDYAAIICPTWFWGGWADLYRDTPFRLAEHLQAPHRVTVGPWAHLYPHEGVPKPAVGFLQEALRWWDRWLRDEPNDVMAGAPFQFYLMDSVPPQASYAERPGRWVGESRWPSANVQLRRLALNDRRLEAVPQPEVALTVCSPQTLGLAGGEWGSFAVAGDLPQNQALELAGALEFDGAPLVERIELLGNASVILALASDRPQAQVAVRLIDVAPDGRATLVARGFLNLAQRAGRENPAPLVPHTRYRVEVPLTGTAYAFPVGHRLRIAVSTTYWPLIWPSPEPVSLTVFTGASELRLPVRTAPPGERALELPAPVAGPVSPLATVRPGRVERTVMVDQLTGEVVQRLFIDGGVFGDCGKIRLDDIDLEMAHVTERLYRIKPDDPNSAKARMIQTYEMGRKDWQIRIEAGAEMTCSAGEFHVASWLEAFEGEASVFRTSSSKSFPRRHS
jgi:putative CocE/NonD family hydrolase